MRISIKPFAILSHERMLSLAASIASPLSHNLSSRSRMPIPDTDLDPVGEIMETRYHRRDLGGCMGVSWRGAGANVLGEGELGDTSVEGRGEERRGEEGTSVCKRRQLSSISAS